MVSDVSDAGVGNLKDDTKSFRVNRKLCGMTWSCPEDATENPIENHEEIINKILEYGEADYIVGKEQHKNGKNHWHAWCRWKVTVDLKNSRCLDISGVHPNILKPKLNGGWKDYVLKAGVYKANIYIPKPLDLGGPHNTWWQLEIKELIKTKPVRKIHWYWEETGDAVKTNFARWVCGQEPATAILVSGKAADMKFGIVGFKKALGYYPEVIFINIPRDSLDYVSYTGMEELMDGIFFSGKYESGMCIFNYPHLIVFANEEPKYKKENGKDRMSMDRWNVKNID